jgi:hypothetical protein
MKPLMKLAATAAMALSIGALPQANAEIMHKPDGKGDALIFPVFNGYIDNYFTISNASNDWVQAHIRFRNGAWCGELLDFDVIFSPGDVLVFRIADVDGDGYWEIDQSLDAQGFEYSGKLENCGPDTDKGPDNGPSSPPLDGIATQMCIDQSDLLVPNPGGVLTEPMIEHARHTGHIEVFAEGVFDNMTPELMERLIDPANAHMLAAEGQREVGNGLGTSIWSWVDAKNGFATGRRASDVGNELSGTAFITVPGTGMGVSYNAEALVNWRTNKHPHRIDNYPHDSAVIVHDDNSIGQAFGPSPFGDYRYGYTNDNEDRTDELRISFNNTWGPTIWDGDDYDVTATWQTDPIFPNIDNWDNEIPAANSLINSLAEVDDAIRAGGQIFTSFYFAGEVFNDSALNSLYFAVFPTKFYIGEDPTLYGGQATRAEYTRQAAARLLSQGKPIHQEIWDHQENSGSRPPPEGCTQSPCEGAPPSERLALGQCVALFDVGLIKSFNEVGAANFTKGRVVLGCDEKNGAACNPMNNPFGNAKRFPTWSFLGYTFEMDSEPSVGQWRAMQR